MRLPLVALILLAPFALADHSPTGRCDAQPVGFGMIQISDGDAARTFYVDDRNLLLGNGVWTYHESNGIFTSHEVLKPDASQPWFTWFDLGSAWHNLQRGGASLILAGESEICVDDLTVAPDTLIL